MASHSPPWHIIGQGMAGSCLAWELHHRKIPFTIHDRGHGGSSRIAAGLINPITGKNFQPSWRISSFHPSAIRFYRKIEEITHTRFWHPMPILRLISTQAEKLKFESKLASPDVTSWLTGLPITTPRGFLSAIEVTGGGWIDTTNFLKSTSDFFSGNLVKSEQIASLPNSIHCQGAETLLSLTLGPHRCAKGEILTVRADFPETHIRVGAGGWLIPIGRGLFRIGSTYEWTQLDELPSPAGSDRIRAIASALGGPDFDIIGHVAGIRPIIRRSQPLVGCSSPGQWFLNGLGSKGVLYAPGMSRILSAWIFEGIRPDSELILDHP